jgi:2-phosphoglycerate kinase
MKNINKFNLLWEKGDLDKPLVIIIGGAAGTGKTVLAYKILNEIGYCNYLVTPIIRSLLTLFLSKKENPYVYKHTFDLHKVNGFGEVDEMGLVRNFKRQSKPIMNGVERFFDFIISEKQNYVIEGSNILPRDWDYNKKKMILIEMYMTVSDNEVHTTMMGGPTHKRAMTQDQLDNARILNEYTVAKAKEMGKMIFEYDADYKSILAYIDQEIGKAIN